MTATPDFAAFKALAAKGNLIPVFRELPADLETPVSAFAKLTRWGTAKRSFLLESVEGGERVARYSYLGVDPEVVLETRGQNGVEWAGSKRRAFKVAKDPLEELRRAMARYQVVDLPGLPPFWGGAVGYLSYDCVRFFEAIPDKNPDTLGFPESLHYLTDTLVVFDHVRHTLMVLALAHVEKPGLPALRKAYQGALARIEKLSAKLQGPLPRRPRPSRLRADAAWKTNLGEKDYCARVERMLEYIRAGDIFQAEMGRRLSKRTSADAFSIYRQLRRLNPSPYMFYFQDGDRKLVGASPEILLKVEGGKAWIRPIAGTRSRGKTPAEDLALEKELLGDAKERAEHIMMVDLARNDLGRVAKPGTVKVSDLMIVERYSHVMHIVSDVEAVLKPGLDVMEVVRASFPAGTMSGSPKIRAMEIIDELETVRRGPYTGCLGFYSFSGNLETALLIRTLYVDGNQVHAQAAAGIVADSSPRAEFHETEKKLKAVVRAVELAESEAALKPARKR